MGQYQSSTIRKNETIYDHQATTTKDSSENLHTEDESKQNHERMGSIKQIGEKKIRNQRITFIQLHTIKPLNNKDN
jgi:hypothetical protein